VNLERSVSFREWKAESIARLSEACGKAKDPKLYNSIRHVIILLGNCNSPEKLIDVLRHLHMLRDCLEDIVEVMPTPEDIQRWFKEADV